MTEQLHSRPSVRKSFALLAIVAIAALACVASACVMLSHRRERSQYVASLQQQKVIKHHPYIREDPLSAEKTYPGYPHKFTGWVFIKTRGWNALSRLAGVAYTMQACSVDGVASTAELERLRHGLHLFPEARIVSFGNMQVDKALWAELERMPQLKEVAILNCSIGQKTFDGTCVNVDKLALDGSTLSEHDLCELLQGMSNLRMLGLRRVKLRPDDRKPASSQPLPLTNKLTDMWLECDGKSIAEYMPSLAQCEFELHGLDLHNTNLTAEALLRLCSSPEKLNHLGLHGISGDTDGVNLALMKFRSLVSFYSPDFCMPAKTVTSILESPKINYCRVVMTKEEYEKLQEPEKTSQALYVELKVP